MKAVIAYGSKKVELDAALEVPSLRSGEVLVKVAAAPIQPSDLLNVSSGFPSTQFPIIPGRDYAGTVVEPSSSPWHSKKVYGTSGPDLSITRHGTHAEYVVVPESALAEVPSNLNLVQASLIGTPWTTAYMTLARAQVKHGETVLVTGAGGNVGSAVVQLAKSSIFGCKVLTAGRGGKYDVDTLAYPDLSQAKDKTGGFGADVVIDTTGDLNLASAALRTLNKKGRLVLITTGASHGSTETEIRVDIKELYRLEHAIVGCNSFEHSMQETADWLKVIAKGFEAGELSPPAENGPRIKKIGLDTVKEAYADLGAGSRQTFVILVE